MVSAERYNTVHYSAYYVAATLFCVAILYIWRRRAYRNSKMMKSDSPGSGHIPDNWSHWSKIKRLRIAFCALRNVFVVLLVPILVVNHAVLDYEHFVITQEHTLNGTSANTSNVYDYPELCLAIRLEYDCFQDSALRGGHSWSSWSIKAKESECETPGTRDSCQVFKRNAAVTCDSDNYVTLLKMNETENMTIADFDHGLGVKCYRWKPQEILSYLDSIGIAAGIVSIFHYTADNMHALFGFNFETGKMPANPNRILAVGPKALTLSTVILATGLFIALVITGYGAVDRNLYTNAYLANNLLIPTVCFMLWIVVLSLNITELHYLLHPEIGEHEVKFLEGERNADRRYVNTKLAHVDEKFKDKADKSYVETEIATSSNAIATQLADMQKMIDDLTEKLNDTKAVGKESFGFPDAGTSF